MLVGVTANDERDDDDDDDRVDEDVSVDEGLVVGRSEEGLSDDGLTDAIRPEGVGMIGGSGGKIPSTSKESTLNLY